MQQSTTRPSRVRTAIFFAALLAWIAPAYAYLDPATGSILLQGLIAGIAGLTVVLRLYWQRIKALFRRMIGQA
ncbi:MAG TPA: hypothetical protein VJ797_13200 [Burkholderiales bacterium]|nr:hypothetical protein [Burkholderiales bacterium]